MYDMYSTQAKADKTITAQILARLKREKDAANQDLMSAQHDMYLGNALCVNRPGYHPVRTHAPQEAAKVAHSAGNNKTKAHTNTASTTTKQASSVAVDDDSKPAPLPVDDDSTDHSSKAKAKSTTGVKPATTTTPPQSSVVGVAQPEKASPVVRTSTTHSKKLTTAEIGGVGFVVFALFVLQAWRGVSTKGAGDKESYAMVASEHDLRVQQALSGALQVCFVLVTAIITNDTSMQDTEEVEDPEATSQPGDYYYQDTNYNN